MGVKKRSGCDNQSQAAGAAEGGVRAALQSRQYATCSWAADVNREALAQVGLSCLAKTPFKFSALQGEYNHILTEVTFLFSVFCFLFSVFCFLFSVFCLYESNLLLSDGALMS